MYRIYLSLLVFFLPASCLAFAEHLPKEGSRLNYRLVGFSVPSVAEHGGCVIELAKGDYFDDASFSKNVVKSQVCKSIKTIIEVPAFGTTYTWRVVSAAGGTKSAIDGFHHFSTGLCPLVDEHNFRLRVTKNAAKFKNAYVFLNGSRAMYDMNGKPVWFMPDVDGHLAQDINVRDLKLTPQGTITFLSGDKIYEISYNGDVLWKSPDFSKSNSAVSEHFHHEFTRLTNGHYMVLGDEEMSGAPESASVGNGYSPVAGGPNAGVPTPEEKKTFGTVIEYDQQGNVVWKWRSSTYFMSSDIFNRPHQDGVSKFDMHENAFSFDEKNKIIYVSFKGISRILKVNYPEGNIVGEFGEQYAPGGEVSGGELFHGQHSCKFTADGHLYLYNNNSSNAGLLPKIEMLEEHGADRHKLRKVWEYQCTVDRQDGETGKQGEFGSGGNVMELPDHAMFVAMAGAYCNTFIVSHDKKILWNAILERWDQTAVKWVAPLHYRASIVTDVKDFERLVWNNDAKRAYASK